MAKVFKGRPVLAGNISGESIVYPEGWNPCDQYIEGFFGGGIPAKGKILCIPSMIGSSTGGVFIQTMASGNKAPVAFLLSKEIDSLAAAGIMLSTVWDSTNIITVSDLGDEFLEYVEDGMQIDIQEDGTVTVS